VRRSHNTIFFHVQQFSLFVLLDMFDSKVVWHLWATIYSDDELLSNNLEVPNDGLQLCFGPDKANHVSDSR